MLAGLSLASLLCSQVSMTLYSQPPSDLAGSENMTAVQGQSVSFRLVASSVALTETVTT